MELEDSILAEELSLGLGFKINTVSPISGGDISKAFCIETDQGKYFLKINQEAFALDMFEKESLGLEEIASYNILNVPKVFQVGQINNSSFLLLEYIESDSTNRINFIQFGIQLAEFHLQFGNSFGWERDNYIGSLHQSNTKALEWCEFYINQRLASQLKMAIDQNLLDQNSIPNFSKLLSVCNRLFLDTKPSPVHGDLWSGNYMCNPAGEVYIIDPAFYYGHHEVDIAMSQLFGGFSKDFYEAYYSIIPMEENREERIQFLQLYYLLVHLNLFGKSYLGSVMSILKKYQN